MAQTARQLACRTGGGAEQLPGGGGGFVAWSVTISPCANRQHTSLKRQRRTFAGASGLCWKIVHGYLDRTAHLEPRGVARRPRVGPGSCAKLRLFTPIPSPSGKIYSR